jgi:glycosyltransferase involved in cell wall biosynthesis
VVIPCYRVRRYLPDVLAAFGPEADSIYVVDDACPEGTGHWVEDQWHDPRVRVLFRAENGGVGAATLTGYRAALADGMEVVVKIDGDGQMDPALIDRFVRPILAGEADYTKGNRFFSIERLRLMPTTRLLGNAVLSFATKLATGYWNVFDPTNGYTAVHARVLELLPLDKLAPRYFFESDLLFRLNTIRALVVDIPLEARYGEETSNLRIGRAIAEFSFRNTSNFVKRIVYNYFLRSFSLASVQLLLGLVLLLFGAAFGGWEWYESWRTGSPATSGTVMVAGLPIIVGMQLLLAFLGFDMQSSPRSALHKRL